MTKILEPTGFALTALVCLACGGSPTSSTSTPRPAPEVELRATKGSAGLGQLENAPVVTYSACGSLIVPSGEPIVFTMELDPIAPDGSVYPSRHTTMERSSISLGGCGLATSYDYVFSHVPATSYRLRLRYQAKSGSAERIVEAMAPIEQLFTALPPKLVISEFRTRGPNGPTDQFVELLNDSLTPKNLAGVSVSGSDALSSGILGPGCHYLLTAPGYSGAVPGDASMAAILRDDGTLGLSPGLGFHPNEVVRYIGLNPTTMYKEGTALPPFGEANTDRSYVRVGDVFDNARDFTMTTPSQPQNTSSCGH